jgi:hypothetical protein
MGELAMLKLEDQVLEYYCVRLLREWLQREVVARGCSSHFTRTYYPCNQLGNELASRLIGQAGIQTGIDKL